MGGSGFPTYAKYETKNKLKTLIVNATESEPYVTCDQKLFETYIDEILEKQRLYFQSGKTLSIDFRIEMLKWKMLS